MQQFAVGVKGEHSEVQAPAAEQLPKSLVARLDDHAGVIEKFKLAACSIGGSEGHGVSICAQSVRYLWRVGEVLADALVSGDHESRQLR